LPIYAVYKEKIIKFIKSTSVYRKNCEISIVHNYVNTHPIMTFIVSTLWQDYLSCSFLLFSEMVFN